MSHSVNNPCRKYQFSITECVIVTPVKMRSQHGSLLTGQALTAIGGPGARPGIFVLSAAERRGSAPVNALEEAALSTGKSLS